MADYRRFYSLISAITTTVTSCPVASTPTPMLNIPRIRVALRPSSRISVALALRANLGLQARSLHASSIAQKEKETSAHTADSYAKDVDATPPQDTTVYRVDPDSDSVQKPYEAPSGFSRAGVLYEEYRHVEGKKQPYAPEGGSKGTYGARPDWVQQKGKETSGPEESPSEKSSRGRQ